MNGILTYFFLFVRSWRFTFYITSFFTGLAVLYDVSIQAVLLAVLPSQCLQEWQGLLSNMSFQTFLQRFSHHISQSSAQHIYETTNILDHAYFKNSNSNPGGFIFWQSRRQWGLCKNTFLWGRRWNTWRLKGLFVCCMQYLFKAKTQSSFGAWTAV